MGLTEVEASLTAFEDALALGGTDESAVVAVVDSAVDLGDGDVLLAVGSLVEGLGTTKSDVDLLLIRAGDGDGDAPDTETAWMVGRCIVDLRVIPAATVDNLIARLEQWAGLPWSLMEAAHFTSEECLLLHRLAHSRQLFPAAVDMQAVGYRQLIPDLARLKLQLARHTARTIQVDMVGYRDQGDYASLVFAGQDLLGRAVDGLLAAYHLTNPYPKWRSRLLDTLPTDWERPLGLRPTGLSAARAHWRLHRAPAEPEPEPALAHARRCTTFARAVFAWAEPRLVRSSVLEPVPHAWGHASQRRGAVLPPLELDSDFSLSGGRIVIARLNEIGTPLEVSAREFAILLLFDGETTVHEAEVAVGGTRGGQTAIDTQRLVQRAVGAGVCAAPAAQRDRRA